MRKSHNNHRNLLVLLWICILQFIIFNLTILKVEGNDGNDKQDGYDQQQQQQQQQQCQWDDTKGECQNDKNTQDYDNSNNGNSNNDNLDPVWYNGSPWAIGSYLKCPWDDTESLQQQSETLKTVHTDETWKTLNRIYHEVMSKQTNKRTPSLPSEYTTNGFHVPIEIKYDPKVGRGIYVKDFVPKGALVWNAKNTAMFHDAQDYRDFLRALPKQLACDVIVWAYVRMVSPPAEEDDYDTAEYMACVDLDEGSFINHALRRPKLNLAVGTDHLLRPDEDKRLAWYGCDNKFYASRDIIAGEELRFNYNEFAEPFGWKLMGL
jgi:hypothetical protein